MKQTKSCHTVVGLHFDWSVYLFIYLRYLDRLAQFSFKSGLCIALDNSEKHLKAKRNEEKYNYTRTDLNQRKLEHTRQVQTTTLKAMFPTPRVAS